MSVMSHILDLFHTEYFLIYLGYCAEFDTDGAFIQENYRADCRKFDSPCPRIYNSAEAYKCELYFLVN